MDSMRTCLKGGRTLGTVVAAVWIMQLLACGVSPSTDGDALTVEKDSQGYLIKEADQPVLYYQQVPKSKNGEYARSNYVHPLYGLDGEVLTEDFPEDHLHHRGIFWAWHQIYIGDQPVGDSWEMKDFSWDVEAVKVMAMDDQAEALRIQASWISPRWTDTQGNPQPFIKETTLIRVQPAADGMRKIDFEIKLRALTDSVRLGGSDNEKGYGGFSARIRLPKNMRFTSQQGPVTPTRLAVEKGPWIDLSGPLKEDGTTSGLAILSHASNPNHPQPWILRQKDSMQNPVYPGCTPVTLSPEEPVRLRYRLIVHKGGGQKIDLEKLQNAYNHEESVLEGS